MSINKVYLLNQKTPVIITGGFVPKGPYNGATDYAVGDSVDYNGSSYVMYADAPAGTLPTNTTYWEVVANKGNTGATGATGATGPAGANGTNGQGVPTGGTTGQVLSKNSATDFDTSWIAQSSGHTIKDEGTSLTQRTNLNFIGSNVTVTDNAGTNSTDVTITGGGLTDGDKGDITVGGSGTTMTIDTGVVSNAKLATAPASTFKANNTAGVASPTDITVAQAKTLLALTKTDVGLGNVDNTSDLAKPISTATQTALDAKQPLDADLTALAALTDPAGMLTMPPTDLKISSTSKGGVFNGSFETGTKDVAVTASGVIGVDSGWYLSEDAGSMSAELDTAITFDGATTLKLEALDTLGAGVAYSSSGVTLQELTREGIPLKASTLYRVSVWAKTNLVGTAGVSMSITEYDATATVGTTTTSNTLTGTNDWTLLTLTVTTGATATYGRIALKNNVAGAINQAWFDLVSLEEVIVDTTYTGKVAEPVRPVFQAVTTVDNIDQNDDMAGAYANTYAVPTAISETVTNRKTFTPTNKYVTKIGVFVVAKGTGNWTLSVHTSTNVLVASKQILNASLTNGVMNYFDVPNIWLSGALHFHLVSTVADGTIKSNVVNDLETASFIQNYAKKTEGFTLISNGVKTELQSDSDGIMSGAIIDLDNGKYIWENINNLNFPLATDGVKDVYEISGLQFSNYYAGTSQGFGRIQIGNNQSVTYKFKTLFPVKKLYINRKSSSFGSGWFMGAGGFLVEVSTDNTTWSVVATHTVSSSAISISTDAVNGSSVFYVRYRSTINFNYPNSLTIEADIDTSLTDVGNIYPLTTNQFTETVKMPSAVTRAIFRLKKFKNAQGIVMPAIEFANASSVYIGHVLLPIDNSQETNPAIAYVVASTTGGQNSGTGTLQGANYIVNDGEYMTLLGTPSEITVSYIVGSGTTTLSNITKNVLYLSSNSNSRSSSTQGNFIVGARQEGLTSIIGSIHDRINSFNDFGSFVNSKISNINNTSDLNKPLSTAMISALAFKQSKVFVTVGLVGSGADYECNGTNDASQIRAAANDNVTIFVKNGTYNFNVSGDRLFFGYNNISIIGESFNGVVFKAMASLHPGGLDSLGRYGILNFANQTVKKSNIYLKNIVFDCNNQLKTSGLTFDGGSMTAGQIGLENIECENISVVNFGSLSGEVVEAGMWIISGNTQSYGINKGYINKIKLTNLTIKNSTWNGMGIYGGFLTNFSLSHSSISECEKNGIISINYDGTTNHDSWKFYRNIFSRNMKTISGSSQAHLRDQSQTGIGNLIIEECYFGDSVHAFAETSQEYAATPYQAVNNILRNNYIGENLDGFSIGASIAGTYARIFPTNRLYICENIFYKCRNPFDEDSTIHTIIDKNYFYKVKSGPVWGGYSRHFPTKITNNVIYDCNTDDDALTDPNATKLSGLYINVDGYVVSGNTFIDDRKILNPTESATLTQVSGGSLSARTYYVRYTFTTDTGETESSSEQSIAIAANNLFKFSFTGLIHSGANSIKVYISTTTNTEKLEATIPITVNNITNTVTNFWQESITGLIGTGADYPVTNTTYTKMKFGIYQNNSGQSGAYQNYSHNNVFIGIETPIKKLSNSGVFKDNYVDNTHIGGLAYIHEDSFYNFGNISGVVVLNILNGDSLVATVNGNITSLTFPSGTYAGQKMTLKLIQDATGSRTATGWSSNVKWSKGTAPTLSTTPNTFDIINFIWDGTDWNGTFMTPSSGGGVTDGDKGDITVSGSGTVWTIDNSTVTLAKQADVATSTVFYRKTAGTGAPEVQTLATLKTDLGLTGTNSGDQTITLSGDVSGSGTSGITATIGNNTVSNTKLAQMGANTIKGNNTGATANALDLTPAQVKTLLAITNADVSGLGTLATQSGTFSGTSSGTNTGDQTITLTGDVTGSGTGSFAATLATVNASPQTDQFRKITVNGKGLVTASTSVTGTDIGNAFGTPTNNLFFATPNGSAGAPSLRAIGVSDIPTLNQSTTGSAGSVANSLSIGAELIAGGASTYNGSTAKSIAIQTNAVTNAMLAQVATATFKGRTTAGTGNVEDLTATQATALLSSFVGDAGSGGTKGLVPAPATGDATKYLKGDGTWGTIAGGGDVTSNTATSVDGEIVLFNGTSGKSVKRATGSGLMKMSSGVMSVAIAGTDYASATSGSSVLKGNGIGGFAVATNADLPVMTATVGGAVPTPPNNTTTFLRGDGTFATPAGGGGGLTHGEVMVRSSLSF